VLRAILCLLPQTDVLFSAEIMKICSRKVMENGKTMNGSQLSLWDNAALENGYRHLAALNLDRAAADFREALAAGIADHPEIDACLTAIAFWQQKLETQPPLALPQLLDAYSRFSFGSKMTAFKKAVLLSVVRPRRREQADPALLPDLVDLLLNVKAFPEAEELAADYMAIYPGCRHLLYVLGKAQWMNDNKVEAYGSYAKALLYCPDRKFAENVQPPGLKDLISRHGTYMAPAFGWIADLLPLVDLAEPPAPAGTDHKHAIDCYLLLQQTQKSHIPHAAPGKENLRCRKELQRQDPALFKADLDRVNKQ
jgi:hypothetical protein